MKKNKFVLIFIIVIIIVSACNIDKNYNIEDIEIFKSTPAWKLAKAIKNHETESAEKLLIKNPILVDYKEPCFNLTLLYWTLYNSSNENNSYYNEAKLLIKYGANPYYVLEDKTTPLTCAANIYINNAKFIQLCIDSKYTNKLTDSLKRIYLSDALIIASGKMQEEVDGVKLLINAGAEINCFNGDSTETPLSASLIQENLNIAKFLLIDKGAKFDYSIKRLIEKTDYPIIEILQNLDFPTNSSEYKIKLDLEKYIKNHS
jgi:uncharacterized protein